MPPAKQIKKKNKNLEKKSAEMTKNLNNKTRKCINEIINTY